MLLIDTPHLHLREFRKDDVEPLVAIFGDAEVMKFGDGVQSRRWVETWVARWIGELYPAWGLGMWRWSRSAAAW